MDKTREFFNSHAAQWDSRENPAFSAIIVRILERFAPGPGDILLDVACGTGILLPFLRRRGVSDYTALDFSLVMASRFSEKHPGVKILAADFQQAGLFPDESFTKIIIYNAFPHFSSPQAVFANAYALLRAGGELCIAHSMNREALTRHHARSAVAGHILTSDSKLSLFYEEAGFVEVAVENSSYFYSRGLKP